MLSSIYCFDVTVDLGFSGTAAIVDDYTRSATQIVIAAGQISGTITLTAVQDTLDESNETIVVDIIGVTNGSESGTQQVTTTISDDDAIPSVTLSNSPVTIAEAGGMSMVTATLSAVSSFDLTVDLEFSGTAALFIDYTRSATQIMIPAGTMSGTVTLNTVQDSLDEINEAILVDIASVTNGAESGDQQVTATIADDDLAPIVTLSSSPVTIAEVAGTVMVTATLSAVSDLDVTIVLGSSGTAALIIDYTRSATQITIPAGMTSGTVTLNAVQDSLDEINETIVLDISGVLNGSESGTQQVTATITDDDLAPIVTLSSSSVIIAEAAGTSMVTATLSAITSFDVTVDLAFSGTANNVSDYTSSATQIVIAAGNTTGTVVLTADPDEIEEPNETILVDITNVTGATESETQQVTVTITDDDGGGPVESFLTIASDTNGGPTLADENRFGNSVSSLGDLDGDGVTDLAVGATGDDTGGYSRGAVHVLLLNVDGTVKSTLKIGSDTNGGPTLANDDMFGNSVSSLGDLDGDGVTDLAVGATGDDTGGYSRGAVHVLLLNVDGTVKSTLKIGSDTNGGPTLANDDMFGNSVSSLGDLDGDGVTDLAVGATGDDTGGYSRGAVHVLLLNVDGTVKSTLKIGSDTYGGPTLANDDMFGSSVSSLGDLDGDGVTDLAVGASEDDTGGNADSDRGAVHVLLLTANGTVKSGVKIASGTNGGPTLVAGDYFGHSVASLGDLDGDGVTDLAVGAMGDDTRGNAYSNRGVVHVLLLNVNGTVKSTLNFGGDTNGGPTLADLDYFGTAVASLGDLDGNGVTDLAVGATGDDTGGDSRGAVHVLFLNPHTMNHAPTLTHAIADQNATVDSAFSFTVLGNTFTDVDVGDSLTYSAANSNGNALPTWLNFNTTTHEFSGTPLNADIGTVSVKVMAIDGSNVSVTDTFDIVVAAGVPTINALPDGGNITIEIFGGNFVVTQGSTTLYSVAVADIPNSLTINGTDGTDDTLIVDFSGGSPLPTGGLTFNGGAGGNDALTLTGGTTTSVTHTFTNANDGSVTLAGALAGTISYTGLEPIFDNLSATDRVFTFNGGAETITLTDAAGANMTIDSDGGGESVAFANPSGSLTINAGTGADIINLDAVDAAYRASLTVNGNDDADIINLNTNLLLGSTTAAGDLSFTAESIHLNSASIATDGDTTNNNAGSVTLDGAVTLGTDVTIDTDSSSTNDGDITFTGAVDATANGAQDLTLTAGSGDVVLLDVGTITRLASLTASFLSGRIFLGGDISTDRSGGKSGMVDLGHSGGIVLTASVTIDTEDGNATGGAVAFTFTPLSADLSGRDLVIDTSTGAGFVGGEVLLGNFLNAGGAYVNDLTLDAAGGAGVGLISAYSNSINLDASGPDTGDFRVVHGQFIVSAVVLVLDTEQVNDGSAGLVDFGPDVVGGGGFELLSLSVNTSTTATGQLAGNVTFNDVDVPGSHLLNLMVTATGPNAANNGNVTFNDAVTLASGGDLTVNAGMIDLPNTASDLTTSGNGTVTLTATKNISLGSGSSIVTADGNLTLSANQQATSTTGNFVGISINNAAISSSGGNITLLGRGGFAGANAFGVAITNGGSITGGGSGTLTSVTGLMGSSSAGGHVGVRVAGTNSKITSGGGDVSVTGTGTEGGTGVTLESGGQIAAGGSGLVTVLGTAGNSGVGSIKNIGVLVDGASSAILSVDGNVEVLGLGRGDGAADGGHGVLVKNGGQIAAAGSGRVTVTGTGGSGSGGSNHGVFVTGTNSQISSEGGAISLTGTAGVGSSTALVIDTSASIQTTGAITLIGNSMDIASAATIDAGVNTVTLRQKTNGTLIDLGTETVGQLSLTDAELDRITSGTLAIGDSASGTITLKSTITLTDAPVIPMLHLTTGSTVGMAFPAAFNVSKLAIEAGGNVVLDSLTHTVDEIAIRTTSGRIAFSASGTFTVTTVDGVIGVATASGNVSLAANNGNITIADTAAANDVEATGTIFIATFGDDRLLTVDAGADLESSGATHTYHSDKIVLNGTITAPGQSVVLQPNQTAEPIHLGATTDSIADTLELSNAELNRITADVLQISDPNFTGAVTVTAAINLTNALTLYLAPNGLVSQDAGATIAATNLALIVPGGFALNEANDVDVFAALATVGNVAFTDADGFRIDVTPALFGITASTGSVMLTALGGNLSIENTVLGQEIAAATGVTITLDGVDAQFVTKASSGILTAAGGIAIAADSMVLGGTLSASGQTVILRPGTDGHAINLGSATDAVVNTLELSDVELDRITAGTLSIGDSASGAITISAAITRTAATDLNLTTAITTGINAEAALTDVNLVTGQLTIASGSNLNITIDGTTVDTQYTQLNVTGAVQLTGVDLLLSGSYTPVGNESFTILVNDGTDLITGTFNGLIDGATISNFLGSGLDATITYFANTDLGSVGNDVVLTVSANFTPTLSINDVSVMEGNSGTSTMTFNVTLGQAVSSGFLVDYVVQNGTATVANNDYVDGQAGSLRIGAFNGSRGGEFSLSNGASAAGMRSLIQSKFPMATISGASTLTAGFLANVDVVWLNSVFNNTTATSPLSGAEQTALLNFVNGGGRAIIFGENDAFDDTTLLAPFGAATTGNLVFLQTGTITNTTDVLTNGPFGIASVLQGNYSGTFTTLGAATPLGAWGNGGTSVAVLQPGALSAGSGRVLLLSDVNYYADQLGAADNSTLLLNALSAMRTPPPHLTFAGTAGETHTITVTINGDLANEPDETLHVLLSNLVGNAEVTIADGDGQGTIENDDANGNAPVITSNGGGATVDLSVAENTTAVLTTVTATDVDLPGDTLTYSISGGADAAKFMLHPMNHELTFVATPDFENPSDADLDNVYEVFVSVSDLNGNLDTQVLSVTVTDVQSTLSINDVAQSELNSGMSNFSFTVTLGSAVSPFSVRYGTQDGTATVANNDYVGTAAGTLRIGAFDGSRGGIFSLSDGANAAAMKSLIQSSFFGATITGTSTLTTAFLSTVDVVWLNSVSGNTSATTPLTGAEQAALLAFVQNGGHAMLFGENSVFDDESLLDPFNATTSGTLTETQTGTITNTTHVLTAATAPFGAVTTLQGFFPGNLTELGSATALGKWNSGNATNVAVLDPGMLSASSGRVVLLADVNFYADQLNNADNKKLFLNALASMVPASSVTLPFAGTANETQLIQVSVKGDATLEGDETFRVLLGQLSGTNDVTIVKGTGVGTILNDDGGNRPVITSDGGDATAMKLVAENSTAVTTVVASDADLPGDTLTYSITGGADAAKFAINAMSGVLTFKTVPDFENPGDADLNNVFQVTVTASDAIGQLDSQALSVTVTDLQATLSISDARATEGSPLSFQVTLSNAIGTGFTLGYASQDGTATVAGGDYVAVTAGNLRIGAFDGTRGGIFSLSNGSSAAAMRALITSKFSGATFVGLSTLTSMSLANVDVVWLNSVSSNTTATSALSPDEQTALQNFVQKGGHAMIFGENSAFDDESLLDPFNATSTGTLTDIQAGTITDLSPTNPLTHGPFGTVSTLQGNFSGSFNSSNGGLGLATELAIWNSGGTTSVAVAGIAPHGVLGANSGRVVLLSDVNFYNDQLNAADNSKLLLNALATMLPPAPLAFTGTKSTPETLSIPVTTNTDALSEGDETLNVLLGTLSGTNDVTITQATGLGTIQDGAAGQHNVSPVSEGSVSVMINDVLLREGNSGSFKAVFTVQLSEPSDEPVTVSYSTVNATATSGVDYKAANGTLTFAPGQTTKTFTILVTGDKLAEATEFFDVHFESSANADLVRDTARVTIVDNDPIPSLSINSVSMKEGTGSGADAVFTVKLSKASGAPVTVHYASLNGTAVAGSDFDQTSGTLTFAPGQTTQTVKVHVTGDSLSEANETFQVLLTDATNATIRTSTGKGTIKNDDKAPSLSIGDVTVIEGNIAVFTVILSARSGQDVTVKYATANGSAKAKQDYTAASGSLTFAVGETTKTISVNVGSTIVGNASKQFAVNLSSPLNAVFADRNALATILDSN